ncbi:MAG: family rane protein [Candidatus Saccharibacteria bacterium]|nr:family rane protein [Candidatus Saccharibacteria bacterium]
MLYTIAGILIVLWLLGFIAHIGEGFIHILIVAAVVLLIYNFFVGRRAV